MIRCFAAILTIGSLPCFALADEEPIRLIMFHQNRVQLIAVDLPGHAERERTIIEQGLTTEKYTLEEARRAIRQHPLNKLAGIPNVDKLPVANIYRKSQLVSWWQLQSTGRTFRVDVAPAVSPYTEAVIAKIAKLLDQNSDGQISKAEADAAEKSLLSVDADNDEYVIALELVPDLLTVSAPKALPQPAIVVVQSSFTSDQVLDDIQLIRPNARIADVEQWLKQPAEMVKLTPTAYQRFIKNNLDVVQYPLDGNVTTLSVIHQQRSWFELLDQNQDGQLSRRELRRTWDALHHLDTTKTGTISLRTLQDSIPISFTFAAAQSVKHGVPLHQRILQPNAPKWFIAIDRNGDHDLSRKEFNGSDTQFKQLDRDGDGLISIEEAKGYTKP